MSRLQWTKPFKNNVELEFTFKRSEATRVDRRINIKIKLTLLASQKAMIRRNTFESVVSRKKGI